MQIQQTKNNIKIPETLFYMGLGYIGYQFLKSFFSEKDTKSIFISHSWKHNKAYNNLIDNLEKDDIKYNNLSISKDEPFCVENTEHLHYCLEQEIKKSSKVVVIAGMYAAHSPTIKQEIALAKRHNKKIIGIKPHGAKRLPKIVTDNADEIIGTYMPNILKKLDLQ